jgi:3-methyl-2-oxobutanoate hydroxymethyltransferase
VLFRSLGDAERAAQSMKDAYTSVEHLLLALASSASPAKQVLATLGAALPAQADITATLATPLGDRPAVATIGIGAGVDCSGQVLVLHDLLGVSSGVRPRFSKDFLSGRASLREAIDAYVGAVRSGSFPGPEHRF